MKAPDQSSAAIDIRDAFFAELHRFAQMDKRVIVLSDDQGAMALDRIRNEMPAQYINVGIAEQNMINVAAGLALGGMRPFVCGISNFMSLRCCEQISVNLSAMNLPVTIVASGGGLTYSSDGPTHHSTQDVAVIRSMPNFTIYNPCDAVSTTVAARMSLASNGPTYVRIEKGILPLIHLDDQGLDDGVRLVREGSDILILSTGYMTQIAAQVSEKLVTQGIRAGVLDVFRLKPFNGEAVLNQIKETKHLLVIEEQTPVGGLFGMICELIAVHGRAIPIQGFCLPDKPCYFYGSRDWLHERFNLDTNSVCAAAIKALEH